MSDAPIDKPRDETTTADDATVVDPTAAATKPSSPWYRRTWTLRRWVAGVAAIAVFAVGAVAGAAGQSGTIGGLEDEKTALGERNDRLREQLNDRDARREADEAAAAREEAEDRRSERERQEAEQAAAEQAQRDAEAAAAAAAAAEAERNTIPGSGIFAIGPEKAPGRYRTEGPTGANPVGCYYALLRAPTSDSLDNIIDNNIVNGPGFADLVEGQFFETTSCQQWVRVG